MDGRIGLAILALLLCIQHFLVYLFMAILSWSVLGIFFWRLLKSKRVYSLNRQTGMVTLFKKGNKERFSHPFIEFDCVLMSAPSPQGI